MLNEIKNIDYKKVSFKIENFIRKKVEESGTDGVVIGLSGGLDSTVTCYLAHKALSSERILALIMPDSRLKDSLDDAKDAEFIARNLNLTHKIIDIAPKLEEILKELPRDKIAIGNSSARLRMLILYHHANSMNRLVLGTGDKSEILIGYFTKYGDGGVDILPIGDLYKTQVRELGRYLGIPESILQKQSSPRLWEGHQAEEEIGLNYDEIDQILYCFFEKGMKNTEISSKLKIEKWKVEKVLRMNKMSEHKRKTPEVCQLF
ncbi:MAG: NAD+ synthase [Candidatus Parvarchaeota archaeon]|nr:NAD+ synthase [Candidatus Jingweiarchaeum tengchongense]MCW1298341.1 NAD+ synthase [Candidatus Jingweiarchaeum tengchongense]MCW1300689.1 NAD+ synthase [Candidatus Jingweiarchaeum tengchongense]MCW1304722.1 NAD+ synthase [Candidatus Jingweiarchaeum tengchongense]MCW1309490.1 NAD+ synthase [Candidatus Jingweiarchaeum tengchongense]